MKTLLASVSSLVLAALLLPAQAQTPATTPAKPAAKPTTQRGTAHKQDTGATTKQTMGRKFIEKSKPTGNRVPGQPHPIIQ